jgi:hypothetical protein
MCGSLIQSEQIVQIYLAKVKCHCHLLSSYKPFLSFCKFNPFDTIGFPKGDTNNVEKGFYDEKTNRVNINKGQYFEGIPKEVWEYQRRN